MTGKERRRRFRQKRARQRDSAAAVRYNRSELPFRSMICRRAGEVATMVSRGGREGQLSAEQVTVPRLRCALKIGFVLLGCQSASENRRLTE